MRLLRASQRRLGFVIIASLFLGGIVSCAPATSMGPYELARRTEAVSMWNATKFAASASEGDLLHTSISGRNNTGERLPAGTVLATEMILDNTSYLRSWPGGYPVSFHLQYSEDGQHWSRQRPLSPPSVAGVRWVLDAPLPTGREFAFNYEAYIGRGAPDVYLDNGWFGPIAEAVIEEVGVERVVCPETGGPGSGRSISVCGVLDEDVRTFVDAWDAGMRDPTVVPYSPKAHGVWESHPDGSLSKMYVTFYDSLNIQVKPEGDVLLFVAVWGG